MTEATPRPWEMRDTGTKEYELGFEVVQASEGEYSEAILDNLTYYPTPVSRADAELIVQAVNAHADLVAALKKIAKHDGMRFFYKDGLPDERQPSPQAIAKEALAALALADGADKVGAEPVRCDAIYVASKAEHAADWRNLRDQGMPIISTWIDEAGIGETQSWSDLWSRCISEAASATGLIVYGRPGEVLKGALAEVGSALHAGVPVAIVGNPDGMKNIRNHPAVIGDYDTVENAYAALRVQPADETLGGTGG